MQKSIIRKGLVAGIIFLFIGVSIAPCATSIEFTKTKTSNNDDLVEITLQLCKTDGVEDHKMFITQEQNEQLDLLIESFKENLDKAETREETIEVYNDMVVSLDELGILPDDLSCKEVQELVTGENSISNPEIKSIKHFNQAYEKLKNKNPELFENSNMFCLISGKTTNTDSGSLGPILIGLHAVFLFVRLIYISIVLDDLLEMYNQSIILRLLYYLNRLREQFVLFRLEVYQNYLDFPIKIGGFITFGHVIYEPQNGTWEADYYPAEGWVYTIGLNGIKTWEDSFFGQLLPFLSPFFYIGTNGFTGIWIREKNFYQGFALRVKLSTNPPN